MTITRRAALATSAGAAAAALLRPVRALAAPFERPPVPYALDALDPVITERTMTLHTELHQAYFETLNILVEGTHYADMRLQDVVVASGRAGDWVVHDYAAQAWNHIHYFAQFAGGPTRPEGALAEALGREFGGLEGLAEEVVATASLVFGAGWVWLTAEGDALFLEPMAIAGNPHGSGRQILFGADLWEHAYLLDYGNNLGVHLEGLVLHLVDWKSVERRFVEG